MYDRILLGATESRAAHRALLEAIRLAQAHRAELRIVHVVDAECYRYVLGFVDCEALKQENRNAGQRILAEAATLASRSGVMVDTALLDADGQPVGRVIVDEARRWCAQLIVIGTRRAHGVERLFPHRLDQEVARMSSIPVLLVPPGAVRATVVDNADTPHDAQNARQPCSPVEPPCR